MHRIQVVINDSIWTSVATPLCVAVLTYFVFGKWDELKKRRNQSKLGVAVMSTLKEEVEIGLNIMKHVTTIGGSGQDLLPCKSWQGINTISDGVLIRILEVTKNSPIVGFPSSEIRIHTKNYFDHMVENWNDACRNRISLRSSNFAIYPEAAQKVLSMLENVKSLLEKNSNKLWPK